MVSKEKTTQPALDVSGKDNSKVGLRVYTNIDEQPMLVVRTERGPMAAEATFDFEGVKSINNFLSGFISRDALRRDTEAKKKK